MTNRRDRDMGGDQRGRMGGDYGQFDDDYWRGRRRRDDDRFDDDYGYGPDRMRQMRGGRGGRGGYDPNERYGGIGQMGGYDRGSGQMGGAGQQRGPHTGHGPKGYQRSDDRIREDVCEALSQHGQLDAREIEVQVQGGEVTLSGSVDSRQAKRMAEDAADDCPGVRDVHNQIRVSQSAQGQQRAVGEGRG